LNARRVHRLPEKEIAKCFLNFIQRGEGTFSEGGSLGGFKKPGSPTPKAEGLKDAENFQCHKKGHYANKCPESKAKDTKGAFKVRKIDDFVLKSESEAKSVRCDQSPMFRYRG